MASRLACTVEHSSASTPDSTPADFDPYQQWLGLSAGHPPNHYELLGLIEFVDSAEQIAAAFESRFQKIRRYEVGSRSDEALKILQYLSAAYAVLSDPQQKRDYDVWLRAETGRDTDVSSSADTLKIESATETANAEEAPDTLRNDAVIPPPAPPFPPLFPPTRAASLPEAGETEVAAEDESPPSEQADVVRHLYVGLLSLLGALLAPFVCAIAGVLAAVALLAIAIGRFSLVLWTIAWWTLRHSSYLAFRVLIGVLTFADRSLLALAGDDNRVVHNWLRGMCIVAALVLLARTVFAAWLAMLP
jgi:hypothetical protein